MWEQVLSILASPSNHRRHSCPNWQYQRGNRMEIIYAVAVVATFQDSVKGAQ